MPQCYSKHRMSWAKDGIGSSCSSCASFWSELSLCRPRRDALNAPNALKLKAFGFHCFSSLHNKSFQTLRSKDVKSIQQQGGTSSSAVLGSSGSMNPKRNPSINSGLIGASSTLWRFSTVRCSWCAGLFQLVNEWQRFVQLAVVGGIFCASGHFEMF